MIVDELIKLQKQKGLNNQQFADSIGIHKISWLRIKRARIIGVETYLYAAQVYPELQEVLDQVEAAFDIQSTASCQYSAFPLPQGNVFQLPVGYKEDYSTTPVLRVAPLPVLEIDWQ